TANPPLPISLLTCIAVGPTTIPDYVNISVSYSFMPSSPPPPPPPTGSIDCRNGPNTIDCEIDQPNVKARFTEYHEVRFLPGDTVSVQAGGCVQTGGVGRTWKRYVDPSGPNSDRLYHGLIWLPGIGFPRPDAGNGPG